MGAGEGLIAFYVSTFQELTSLANLDHLSLDYCLRSCDSLSPVLQTDQTLCDDDNDNDNGASSISQQPIAG